MIESPGGREPRGCEIVSSRQASGFQTPLWHPFADMGTVQSQELVFATGKGFCVYDEQGREYVDATASLWYANVGYGRPEIASAVMRQMERLPTYSIFGDYANRPALALAERLRSLVPVDDAVIFLTSGGSDGIDTAAKLTRRYWSATGNPERRILMSRAQSYHGMHGFGTTLAGIPANVEGFGPGDPEHAIVRHDDAAAFEEKILGLGPGRIAAFFVEPVIGAGGVIPPRPGYLDQVAEICRKYDVVLIADEVVTGFGRVGAWFGCDRFGLRPDLIVGAKGLPSGYLPLGMVAVCARVAEPFWRRDGTTSFRHGYTYSGHATACPAALANIDIIEREELIAHVRNLELILEDMLKGFRDHPAVGEVRHCGLLGAVQLASDLVAERPAAGQDAVQAARERGVLTRLIPGPSFQISPPFVITAEGIGRIGEALREALDHTLSPGAAP
jgi:putrescine---pyruvate transaminase